MILDFGFKARELNRKFADLITGKSVAIIGSGPTLTSCNGEYIDSFDVVVRIHELVPKVVLPGSQEPAIWYPPPFVPTEWHKYVGKRTDIYYDNLGDPCTRSFMKRAVESFKDEGGLFWCVQSADHYLTAMSDKWHISNIIDIRPPDLELHRYVQHYTSPTYFMMGWPPLEGTLIVADILTHDISSVFIAGMDCYVNEKAPPQKEVVQVFDNKQQHRTVCSASNFFFLRNLWEQNENVSVDPVMKSLFEKWRKQ